MTRGNQRDKAREKNLKKQADLKKAEGSKGSGQNLLARKERDAQIMRDKQAAKAAAKGGAAGGSGEGATGEGASGGK